MSLIINLKFSFDLLEIYQLIFFELNKIKMFENRHFDTFRKTWHIGEDHQGKEKIWDSMNKFYSQLNNIIQVSEEIREINS
jgi:hypothetical protein